MPSDITPQYHGDPIELDEFVARLDQQGVDLTHDDGIAAAAVLLARLHGNRRFLVDRALAALKDHCADQSAINGYGAQVLLLHRRIGRHFVRANFWPAMDDPVLLASGPQHYFYHVPHDHNFDFLTIGHIGPGYGSRWFTYDNAAISGFPGEPAGLRLIEEGVLAQGRLLHYRAHRDVHDQLPPSALSISLNIIPEDPAIVWHDQYLFDFDRGCVQAIPTLSQGEIALRIAASLSDDGLDLAHSFARHHPSDRVRWHAWRAIAGANPDASARISHYCDAISDRSLLVSRRAAAMVDRLTGAMERQVDHGGNDG